MGICESSTEEVDKWKPYDQQPEDAPKPYDKPSAIINYAAQEAAYEDKTKAPVPDDMIEDAQVRKHGYYTHPPGDTEYDVLRELLEKIADLKEMKAKDDSDESIKKIKEVFQEYLDYLTM